jgi:reductive dehalogenase
MSSENEKNSKISLNRRQFLKAGAASAVVGTVAAASLPAKASEKASESIDGPVIKVHDEFPVRIREDYKRFPLTNIAFMQALTGRFSEARAGLAKLGRFTDEKGMTQAELALQEASWFLNDTLSPYSQYGIQNSKAYNLVNEVKDTKCKFESLEDASAHVKKGAAFLGADMVGITHYDERWTYSEFFDVEKKQVIPPDLPFEPKSVIVMVFEMDYEAMSTAPSKISASAVGKGYSEMTVTATSVTKFINEMGYKAFAAGNDIALSVPYAIAAGLGEAGRNGILINYKYGPRVRIAKVFTEMELAHDKPITFGVRHFCENCMRCADACPGKCISKEKKPKFGGVANECSNPATEKWPLDAKKCLLTWGKLGTDCATCITSCPYNKPDFWHHRLVDRITKLMPGPVHNAMREMDILFGYGDTYDKKSVDKFWKYKG